MKAEIIKFADQSKDGELSEEDLSEVAGGWGWFGFGFGSAIGGFGGAIVGCVAAVATLSNPVGWIVGGCALAGAAVVGGAAGALTDDSVE